MLDVGWCRRLCPSEYRLYSALSSHVFTFSICVVSFEQLTVLHV